LKCFRKDPILRFLKRDSRINNLFLVDDYCILFEAVFKGINEKRTFRNILESFNLKDLVEYSIFEELKREEFIPSF